MKKKALAVLLALTVVLSLSISAHAAGTEFVINVPEEAVSVGDSFVVTVELRENVDFNALQFTLHYDGEALTCDYANVGSLLGGYGMAITSIDRVGRAVLSAASVDAVEGDGILVVIGFTARKPGETDFSLTLESFTDENFITLPSSVSDAVLTIHNDSSEPGTGTETEPGSEPGPGGGTAPGGETTPGSNTNPGDKEPVAAVTFTDTVGHWSEKYVSRAAQLGLVKGYGSGRFGPNDLVTREQFVLILYRMYGSPEPEVETPFTDISGRSAESRSAIAWAYENGYVNGVSKTAFDPTGAITRESVAKILFLLSGGKVGFEVNMHERYDGIYTDMSKVSSWARDAMYWAISNSMITGTSSSTISPSMTATRGQIAKILVSYYDRFGN